MRTDVSHQVGVRVVAWLGLCPAFPSGFDIRQAGAKFSGAMADLRDPDLLQAKAFPLNAFVVAPGHTLLQALQSSSSIMRQSPAWSGRAQAR
jgi:hypothetical protein